MFKNCCRFTYVFQILILRVTFQIFSIVYKFVLIIFEMGHKFLDKYLLLFQGNISMSIFEMNYLSLCYSKFNLNVLYFYGNTNFIFLSFSIAGMLTIFFNEIIKLVSILLVS